MSQESDHNLLRHLQDLEQKEAGQCWMHFETSDGSTATPEDTLAYPVYLLRAETPHAESFSDPQQFREHLKMMSGQVDGPSFLWEKTDTGLVSVVTPEMEREEATAASYLERLLVREGSIVGRPHDWMLAYLPAGPYNELGLHVTLIANPRVFQEGDRRTPVGFSDLDPIEQAEFLDTTEAIFQWCRASFPEETFAMNVNRGWPIWDEDTKATTQTVQSIHAQIFALPKERVNFQDAYTINPDTDVEKALNEEALGSRLFRRIVAGHNILERYIRDKLPELEVENEGDMIRIKLEGTGWGDARNCALIAKVTRWAGQVMWMERITGSKSFGYSWSIEQDNILKVGFSDNGHSTELFHHTAIIRGSQDPVIRQQVQNGQDALKATLPKMLSGLPA